MDPKVEQRRPFGAPRASPDLQKQAKTLVKIDVFTMCIKLALGTIFSPLGPPRGGPSDLKGAQSAETVSIWDTILSIFSIFFCLGCKIGQVGGPRTPKGASWTHFWGLFEGLLDAFCCTSPAKTQANRWSFPDAGKTSRCGGVASCVLNNTSLASRIPWDCQIWILGMWTVPYPVLILAPTSKINIRLAANIIFDTLYTYSFCNTFICLLFSI